MPQILVVDDDRLIRTIVDKALTSLGYQVVTVSSGEEGLSRIKSIRPDLVITDKMMPGIDGYEFTRRLRLEPDFAHTPVLVLTSESELRDKLDAFDAGADDYLSKPFEAAELAARIHSLLRRAEAFQAAQEDNLSASDKAEIVAVHSLRGGNGTSSLATNLAVALANLWQAPTLLADMNMSVGQISLLLNATLKRNWADLASFDVDEIDFSVIANLLGQHESGLKLLNAPGNPIDAEKVHSEIVSKVFQELKPRFEYIITDLPHDFSSNTLEVLDISSKILLVMAPEMASVRAAAIAIDTYRKLNYPTEKIHLILNWTFEHGGLSRKKIEAALRKNVSLVLPFAPRHFINAINRGKPFVFEHPEDPVSSMVEDFAFRLSKKAHRSIAPASPSATWHRVNERMLAFQKNRKARSRLF